MITGNAKVFENSKPNLLDNLLKCNDYYAKLFSNNLDENAPLFIECAFIGYSSKKLDKGNWNASTIENSQVVSYYKTPVAWYCDDPTTNDINGYFIVDEADNVIWYYKFPSTVRITSLQAISLNLRVVLGCV
jgi:hypothetical protein